MFQPFWFNLSISSKHFSFHVLIFILLSLPLAHLVRKTSQVSTWKLKMLLANWKVLLVTPRDEKYHFISDSVHASLIQKYTVKIWIKCILGDRSILSQRLCKYFFFSKFPQYLNILHIHIETHKRACTLRPWLGY